MHIDNVTEIAEQVLYMSEVCFAVLTSIYATVIAIILILSIYNVLFGLSITKEIIRNTVKIIFCILCLPSLVSKYMRIIEMHMPTGSP